MQSDKLLSSAGEACLPRDAASRVRPVASVGTCQWPFAPPPVSRAAPVHRNWLAGQEALGAGTLQHFSPTRRTPQLRCLSRFPAF